MKKILVLAAGHLQLPAIITAKRMGLWAVALDGNPEAPGLRVADKAYVVDIMDPEACLKIALSERIDGVVHICSEVAMDALGLINERMGLNGLDRAAVRRATNKAEMRKAFALVGAPSPRAFEVVSETGISAAARFLGGDVIIKPSRNSGSRGVTKIQAGAPEKVLFEALALALRESRDPSAVIEEFVQGPEFSVELLVWEKGIHPLAVTDKVTTGSPHFVEVGHSQPSQSSEDDQKLCLEAAGLGINALDIDWCAAHVEVKLTKSGAVLMEIGGRLGGDFITTELVPRSKGIDMVEGAIRLALGEIPDIRPSHASRGAAIRYLSPKPGVVTKIDGAQRASGCPGVQVIEIGVKLGDIVPKMTSSLSRVGYVIAEGSDAAEAIARADEAARKIRIDTIPVSS